VVEQGKKKLMACDNLDRCKKFVDKLIKEEEDRVIHLLNKEK
jgi:hypothetical protein